MLSHAFARAHPQDAARVLEGLPPKDIAPFLKEAPVSLSAPLIREMSPVTAALCLEMIGAKPAAGIIMKLPFAISLLLLRRMNEVSRQSVLNILSPDKAENLHKTLKFPEGTAGALMDPNVFVLMEDVTVREALQHLRKRPEHMIYYIFVVNRGHTFVGFIDIRELMQADTKATISTLMHTDMRPLFPRQTQRAIVENPGWRLFHALPVVDDKGIFLGAIGYKTLRRLEIDSRSEGRSLTTDQTNQALGELYWLGLSGLFKGLFSAMDKAAK